MIYSRCLAVSQKRKGLVPVSISITDKSASALFAMQSSLYYLILEHIF